MKTLDDALHRALDEIPHHALAALISKKLAAQGVHLSSRALERLQRRILEADTETVTVWTWKWWQSREVVLEFTDDDLRDIEKKLDDFSDRALEKLIQPLIGQLAHDILATLKASWDAESRQQRRDLDGFRKRLRQQWGAALGLLQMLLTVAREVGASVNQELRESPDPGKAHLIEVLTRLHARACQLASEVICLLENGFSDGAMARWRTVHEVAVVAIFIHENGDELAERYMAHEAVESYRAAKDYFQCYERLGYDPITPDELDRVKTARDEVVARYGDAFGTNYGWAAEQLKNRRPSFADIERAVSVDHLRAHYRMASHPVHANPKGVYFKLGLLAESDLLLAGPSDVGLTDPAHSTAISLMQVTATLVLTHVTFDHLVILQLLATLADEVGDAFSKTDELRET